MCSVKRKFFIVVAACVLLTGCMIGPKYIRPSAPLPTAYKESKDWKAATPKDAEIKGEWWKIFNDPRLNDLESQINISNQNIAVAEAQYAQAYALVQAANSSFFPIVTTGASFTRSHGGVGSSSGGSSSQNTNQTILNANVSWVVDLWGRLRQTLVSYKSLAQASAADLENAKLSAQAQLAIDYFELASDDQQKKLLDDTDTIYQKFYDLTKNQYNSGVAAESAVIQAKTQLEATEAESIDIGVARAQTEHAIAVLIGKPPSGFSIPPVTLPTTVPVVPVGLPAELLERRPDVAAAERTVASANALIGVAESAYFPTLTLNASGSFESEESNLANLFSSPNPLWSVGPSLAETIFDAGLRQAETAQAKAVWQQDVATYRQTVLTAIQQVEDNLAALRILEQEENVQDATVKDAQKAVDLEMNEYKQGIVSALDVITVQATALSAEKTDISLLGERMNACVLLIEYLGGGWTADQVIK